MRNIVYCKKCLYPVIAVNLILDDEGICSACRLQEDFDHLTEDLGDQAEQIHRAC